MHIITDHSSVVDIQWYLPEVEWHDATVELQSGSSPAGREIVAWHIDTTCDGEEFVPSWSSGRARAGQRPVRRSARIRMPRHDGPCLVAVRLIDSSGAEFISTFSQNRR